MKILYFPLRFLYEIFVWDFCLHYIFVWGFCLRFLFGIFIWNFLQKWDYVFSMFTCNLFVIFVAKSQIYNVFVCMMHASSDHLNACMMHNLLTWYMHICMMDVSMIQTECIYCITLPVSMMHILMMRNFTEEPKDGQTDNAIVGVG